MSSRDPGFPFASELTPAKIAAQNAKHGITKETNPKDIVGVRKVPMSCVPRSVLMEVALAMFEGARKYGRYNWRKDGVVCSVYLDALDRHVSAFVEGEDIDAPSGLSHVTKAIATLTVLRDAMIRGDWIDDRPPKSPPGWVDRLNELAADIVDRFPDAKQPITETLLASKSDADRIKEAPYDPYETEDLL